MKKGKYIDINVMLAYLSHKKSRAKLINVDKLIHKACAHCDKQFHSISNEKAGIKQAQLVSNFA